MQYVLGREGGRVSNREKVRKRDGKIWREEEREGRERKTESQGKWKSILFDFQINKLNTLESIEMIYKNPRNVGVVVGYII